MESFKYTQRHHLARLDGASVPGRVVFLGSSTFQGLDVSAITPVGLNLGFGGDTFPGLIARMSGYQSLARARAVVINIGLNDLMLHCAVAKDSMDRVLAYIPAATPVVILGVQGIAPRRHGERCNGRIPELISGLNKGLADVCARREKCSFVSHPISAIGQTFDDAILQESDGVHLSVAGYRQLIPALRNALAVVDPRLAAQPVEP